MGIMNIHPAYIMNKFVGIVFVYTQEMQWEIENSCPVATCHLTLALLCRNAESPNVNERRDCVSYGN